MSVDCAGNSSRTDFGFKRNTLSAVVEVLMNQCIWYILSKVSVDQGKQLLEHSLQHSLKKTFPMCLTCFFRSRFPFRASFAAASSCALIPL